MMTCARAVRAMGAVAGCTLLLLVSACGSKKEAAEEESPSAAATQSTPAATTQTKAGAADEDVSQWFETELPPATPVKSNLPADPDEIITRYKRECAAQVRSPECRALRVEVERIFLDALVAMRASRTPVDPRWYRLAATAETPQLACIGLTQMIWDPKRTARDEAVIMRALDSSYRGVRAAVLLSAQRLPTLENAIKRTGKSNYRELYGLCVDDRRDPVPGSKWAGGYPGAKFRAFASDESRRWFTTSDSPEKVSAWFAARGKPARTVEELATDAQAALIEEMTRLSSSPDAANDAANQEKMLALLSGQHSEAQWSQAFQGIEGTGEVKYVMIGANQAIAIFRDEFLQATSIVATQPLPPRDLHPDMEELKEDAEMRSILGY